MINSWRRDQLGFPESLAARTVKQNGITVCFPDCREAERPGTIQVKVHAARRATAHQNSFNKRKQVCFKLVFFTQGLIYVTSYRI
jgi:hypothetical protein